MKNSPIDACLAGGGKSRLLTCHIRTRALCDYRPPLQADKAARQCIFEQIDETAIKRPRQCGGDCLSRRSGIT